MIEILTSSLLQAHEELTGIEHHIYMNTLFHYAAWGGRIILVVATGYVITRSETQIENLISLAVFLFASFIPLFLGRKLPSYIDFLLILAALINAGAWVWQSHRVFGLYDVVTHTYTSFAMAFALGNYLIKKKFTLYHAEKLITFLTIVCIGISLGALWEIYEWTIDFFVTSEIIPSLNDTIIDLILDSLGSLTASGILIYLMKERKNFS